MRKYAQTDGNQPDIVKALRAAGASVAITAAVGDGFTDLVVGYRGVNFMLEVKDPSQQPNKRRLTPDQQKFHENWRGAAVVVETVDQALNAIGARK